MYTLFLNIGKQNNYAYYLCIRKCLGMYIMSKMDSKVTIGKLHLNYNELDSIIIKKLSTLLLYRRTTIL